MAIDWRIQAATITASDLPAAYPGGPSHPAGSVLVLVSQVTPRKGPPITFPAPSAAALAMNLAAEAARSAETVKSNLEFGEAPSPDGTVRNLKRDSTGQLFDYFEKCLVSVVFSVQALEAYSNYKLAYNLKEPLQVERRGTIVTLALDDAERELSLDEKIGAVLPDLLGLRSPRGQIVWERYVHLRRLRDATVHFKSRHQWSTAGATFDESPYAYFVQESPLAIPRAALEVLRYFALSHELAWVDGANTVLEGEGKP